MHGGSRPPWPENECAAPALTIEEARIFISECTWVYAKTMPWCEHWYITRMRVDNDRFVGLTKLIREAGEKRKWASYRAIYLDLDDGFSYWTQGAPIASTFILNRARSDSTPLPKPRKSTGVKPAPGPDVFTS